MESYSSHVLSVSLKLNPVQSSVFMHSQPHRASNGTHCGELGWIKEMTADGGSMAHIGGSVVSGYTWNDASDTTCPETRKSKNAVDLILESCIIIIVQPLLYKKTLNFEVLLNLRLKHILFR